ncbi:MAG: hypothetical protein ACOX7G_08445 [Candidatus Scatomorpha sp.]
MSSGDDGISAPVDVVESSTSDEGGAAVIEAAYANIIVGCTNKNSLKCTAIYDDVCFVPNASAAVCIAGDNLAVLDSHVAAPKVLNTSGGDAAAADAVNERESAVVVYSIETATCGLILVNSDCLAV